MPLRPHARTVALARLHRVLGAGARRGRLPRQAQPDGVRLDYYRALLGAYVRPLRDAYAAEFPMVLHLLGQSRPPERADAGEDGPGPYERRVRELLDRAARRAAEKFRPRELRDVALRFGKATSDFQREQLDRQVRAAVGVPLSAVERPIADKLEGFAAVNVDLIKTIGERYHDRVRQDVLEAFRVGMRPEELAGRLVDLDGIAESDARRIARDQIGKLNGQLNEERQKALGVTGYVWRTSNDNRVRDEHRDREGKHYEWSDPPEDGHPGEPIQCRCTAEPDFGAIRAGVDQ